MRLTPATTRALSRTVCFGRTTWARAARWALGWALGWAPSWALGWALGWALVSGALSPRSTLAQASVLALDDAGARLVRGGADASVEMAGERLHLVSGDDTRVAISDDGRTLAVGEPHRARVSLFDASGENVRTLVPITLHDQPASSRVGAAVAVSGDGQVLFVAGTRTRGRDVRAAAVRVWVFVRAGDAFFLTARLSLGVLGREGGTVSLATSHDGSRLVVGLPAVSPNGFVHRFEHRLGGWRERAPLIPTSEARNARLGSSVACSDDGSVIALGAPNWDRGAGAVWLFGWDSEEPLGVARAPDADGSKFGFAVALSRDGRVLVVGAPRYEHGEGRAYRYENGGGGFELVRAIDARVGARRWGWDVALSGDGSRTEVIGRRHAEPRFVSAADTLEIALRPIALMNFALDDGAEGWFGEHTAIGLALEARGVVSRTLVLGAELGLSYGVSHSGIQACFLFCPPRPLQLSESRVWFSVRSGLRADISFGRHRALAFEGSIGASTAWVRAWGGTTSTGRAALGPLLELRLAQRYRLVVHGLAVRAEMLFSPAADAPPEVVLQISYSVALSIGL